MNRFDMSDALRSAAAGRARPPHTPFPAWFATVSLLTAAMTGCQHASLADRVVAERQAGIRRTWEAFVASEASRGERLDRAGHFLENEGRFRENAFRRSVNGLGEMLQYDIRRFRERQPEYPRKAGEVLRGQPGKIERHAIILFL